VSQTFCVSYSIVYRNNWGNAPAGESVKEVCMKPEVFFELPVRDQVKVLYERGTFVVAIRYYGYKVNLYLMQNYYVEVFYNHKQDCIEKIELFNPRHKRLKFYTDQISLPAGLI
jgi:hypothetical protein